MFGRLIDGIKTLIFPDNCLLCRRFLNSGHQQQLCASCLSQIKMNTPPFCLRCSRHLGDASKEGLCRVCQRNAYDFDVAWSVCLYVEPMDKILHAFKYHAKTGLRKTFAPMIYSFIETYHVPIQNFSGIVAIPLHPSRLRERGFNQSQILASLVADYYRIPLHDKILSRARYTETQTNLQAKQRWTNVQGAFKIDDPSLIKGKNILIVDDLLTTAATVHSAAGALKEAGAAYVGVLTLAITQ